MKNLIIIAEDGEVSPGQLITADLENTAFRTSSAHTYTHTHENALHSFL